MPTAPSVHPGPSFAPIGAHLLQALIEHARAGYPIEACGLLIGPAPAAAGGEATRWEPTRNKAASPYRYEIDPDDLYRIMVAADDADEVIWGIVHSHTHTPAVPSATDIGLAFYPDALYLLVSLADDQADTGTGSPSVRAWRILDGQVHEVELLVTP
jgi:proteasome lid subunit RPN8/RPN11